MLKSCLLITTLVSPFAIAQTMAQAPAANAKQSELAATASFEQDKVKLTFKVVPAKDMIVNFDAPWKLEITKAEGLSFAKNRYERSDMNDTLPGYLIASAAPVHATSGDVAYSAVVFVCDKDKTRCFREVHAGSVSWKKAGQQP